MSSSPSLMSSTHVIPDNFNPCVSDTFLEVPDAGIVVVPWRVFQIFPEVVSPRFRSEEGEITYDAEVNVFMSAETLLPSKHGHLEEFTQSWVIKVSTEEELDDVTQRLTSFPSLLCVTLTKRNVFEENSEIPLVIFISPESQCIRNLVSSLGKARHNFQAGKKFAVEVDLGPSVQQWGKKVLRQEFLSVGARLFITSGAIFNHVFDWTNVLGCVPCLPCGVIGSSAYRVHRMIKYEDQHLTNIEDIAVVGTKGLEPSSQRFAVYLLMQWMRVFRSLYCEDCRLRLRANSKHEKVCTCEWRSRSASESLWRSNRVAPGTNEGGDNSENEGVSDGKAGAMRTGEDGDPLSMHDSNNELDGKMSGQNGDVVNTDHGTGVSGAEDKKKRRTGKFAKKSRLTKRKKGKGPFAPYEDIFEGTAISRKKNMLMDSKLLQMSEKEVDSVLNTIPGALKTVSVPQTVFKYPPKGTRGAEHSRGSRRGSFNPDFIEIQLTMANKSKDDGTSADDKNQNAAEKTLETGAGSLQIVLEDDGEEKAKKEIFCFPDDDVDEYFHGKNQSQSDVDKFLSVKKSQASDSSSRDAGKSVDKPVTKQPRSRTTESNA